MFASFSSRQGRMMAVSIGTCGRHGRYVPESCARGQLRCNALLGHIAFAVVLQMCIAYVFRSWAAGAATASSWVVSREIAQAEYRWIEHYGDGLRANMPWWGGLDYRVWQRLDPWLDWVLPCAVTVAIAMLVSRASKLQGQ